MATTIDNTKESCSQQTRNLPLTDQKEMQELLNRLCSGQMIPSNADSYAILRYGVFSEYKNLPKLCSTLFAQPVMTSRLFDIFDLFHRAHFKSTMWYTVIKYIAVRLKELSTLEEYLSMPYDRVRPRCTTLFRYLPTFMEKEEHLLDYIIRWGRYDYDERKGLIPRLLERIYIRDVSGSFVKKLVCKLFDVEYFGDRETKSLRTFVRMVKRSQNFCFQYQMLSSGRWDYVNCQVGEPIIDSKFAVIDGTVFNLRCTYDDADAESGRSRYTFRSAAVSSYENLLKSNGAHSIVKQLKSPTFSTLAHTPDMVSTNTIAAGIYVYLPLENRETTKFLHEQLYIYNCERDEWHQHRQYGKSHLPLLDSCLISNENCIYLIGGSTELASAREGSFFVLDAREGTFKKLPSLESARVSVAACVFDDKIYVAGGMNNETSELLNRVDVFDFKAGRWSGVAPMLRKRLSFKLVPFENKLWALGKTQAVVEAYDTRTNSWSFAERSLIGALGDPIILDMLRPEPPRQYYSLRVLDALVF